MYLNRITPLRNSFKAFNTESSAFQESLYAAMECYEHDQSVAVFDIVQMCNYKCLSIILYLEKLAAYMPRWD